jgi:hypothetical protein
MRTIGILLLFLVLGKQMVKITMRSQILPRIKILIMSYLLGSKKSLPKSQLNQLLKNLWIIKAHLKTTLRL